MGDSGGLGDMQFCIAWFFFDFAAGPFRASSIRIGLCSWQLPALQDTKEMEDGGGGILGA